MMDNLLGDVINLIHEQNPMHAKKLKKNLNIFDEHYIDLTNEFLEKYFKLLKKRLTAGHLTRMRPGHLKVFAFFRPEIARKLQCR